MTLRFDGFIANHHALIEQLGLSEDATKETLIENAFARWGLKLNHHIIGDYALVLHADENKVLFCRSAFSSYPLFYKATQTQIQIESDLNPFKQNAEVDPLAIRMLMEFEVVLPPKSLLGGVAQLASGESCLWQQNEPVQHQQMTLTEKLNQSVDIQAASPSDLPALSDKPDFNQLPQLARTLGQPLTGSWQVDFAEQVKQSTDDAITSESGPEFMHFEPHQLTDIAGKLLSPLISKTRQKGKVYSAELKQQYQQQMLDWHSNDKPDFHKWFALSYKLPDIWSQMRKIAKAQDKTITFSYTNPVLADTLLNSTKTQRTYASRFSFDDVSIKNLYDAMQRLMWHGKTDFTRGLFNIVPPLSAGLLKQHPQHPKLVDNFCLTTLTLDHLAKQNQWLLQSN